MKASAIRAVVVMCPENAKAARAADCSMASTCVKRTSLRVSKRSIHTPAKGARTNTGIWLANPTSPTMKALPVRR
jgi:hypothetical protein